MGSVTVTATFTGDERALERWFADQVADDEREYGHRQGYSGRWNSCGSLSIMRRIMFRSIEDAEAWFEENLEKRGDVIAVQVDAPNETFEQAYPVKARTLLDNRSATRNAVEMFPRALLLRIKAGKSKTRGSAIAVAHIHGLICPVCHQGPFCVSETDRLRLERLRQKATDAQAARSTTLSAIIRSTRRSVNGFGTSAASAPNSRGDGATHPASRRDTLLVRKDLKHD